MSKIRRKITLTQIRLKKIVAYLVVLGIVGAMGIVPSKAEGQMLTPTMAMRYGEPDTTGEILDMAAATFDGKTYLVVLEQGTVYEFIPVEPPDDGFPPWPAVQVQGRGIAEPQAATRVYLK